MAETTIEWTETRLPDGSMRPGYTMNFWIGCQEVSPACDHCYAKTQNAHWKWVKGWGPDGERRRTSESNWRKLRKWNKAAKASGFRAKVFSNSLSDFFDNKVPDAWRQEAWKCIEQSPDLDFLILTKRPQNIAKMLPNPALGVKPWGSGWPNVWLGTTIENRVEGARRAWVLAQIPAVCRFWSCEPLLEDLGDLTGLCLLDTASDGRPAVSWVISGGESGPGKRLIDPDWLRNLRDQCAEARVPFFAKQMDKVQPLPLDLMVREFPNIVTTRSPA